MIRAAIFDLDGVLLDSMKIWKDLGVRYVKRRGLTPLPGMNEILFSMSMEQGAEYLAKNFDLHQTEAEVFEGMKADIKKFYYEEVKAKPGAAEVLQALKEHSVRMCAATSSPRDYVTRALDRNGLLFYMDFILTTSEIGESKHSPLIYQKAAGLLDAAPEETLVFEDSLYALKTAKTAGFLTVGVYDADGETRQEILEKEADFYCRSLRDFCADAVLKAKRQSFLG